MKQLIKKPMKEFMIGVVLFLLSFVVTLLLAQAAYASDTYNEYSTEAMITDRQIETYVCAQDYPEYQVEFEAVLELLELCGYTMEEYIAYYYGRE